MGDREKGGKIMGAICSLPLACKQGAKYKKSQSIIAVSSAFCKKIPHWHGVIPKMGKRRLKGAGKILILFAGWLLIGMNQ